MTITKISSREFNQDIGKAKLAALFGPVFITDRGNVAHVFLSIDEYLDLTNQPDDITNILSMPEAAEIEFEAPKMNQIYKPADFS